MRLLLLILTMIGIATGCVDSRSEDNLDRGGYPVESSTVERFTTSSNVIELYTPGKSEIGLYDPTTGRLSTAPASPSQCAEFVDGLGDASDSPRFADPTTDAVSISCSSRDKQVDCFCTGTCCRRTQTTCDCC